MQAFIGLTKPFVDEMTQLVEMLRSVGIRSRAEAFASGLLTETETNRLRVYFNVADHPELNLWNMTPELLEQMLFN